MRIERLRTGIIHKDENSEVSPIYSGRVDIDFIENKYFVGDVDLSIIEGYEELQDFLGQYVKVEIEYKGNTEDDDEIKAKIKSIKLDV